VEPKKSATTLPADLTHYLIPFTDVVAKFMEVLEVGEFTGRSENYQEKLLFDNVVRF
jgi:hypothetical protein